MAVGTGHFGIVVGAKDAASKVLGGIGGAFITMGANASAALSRIASRLNITTSATEQMNVAMGISTASTITLAGSMKTLGLGIAAVVAGAIGLVASFKAANVAGNFEEGLARVGAISKATAAEMKLLKDAAIQAGIETQFSPDEAVQGLQNLAAMGFNAQKSIQVLLPTLDLAAGGMIGVAEATSTMTSALNIFGLKAEDAGLTADKLLRITQLTALQANDLQLALANVSKGAVATKQSLDEMLIVMGLVKNAGLDVSVTSTATSQALIRMATGADKFAEIGVKIEDAQGRFRPFADIVLDTQKAIKGLGGDVAQASKITELFGIRGQAAFVNVARAIEEGVTDSSGRLLKGAAAVAFMRQEIANSKDTALEFRNIMNSTWNGIKRLIVGSVKTIQIVLGDKLLPVFKAMGIVVKEAFILLLNIIQAIPGPVLQAVGVFIVLASALLVVKGLMLIIGSIMSLVMIPTLGAMAAAAFTAAAGMWAAFWPVLLILGLVSAGIALIFHLLGRRVPRAGSPAPNLQTPTPGSLQAPIRARPAIAPPRAATGSAEGPLAASLRTGRTEAAQRVAATQRGLTDRDGGRQKIEITTVVQADNREIARGVDEIWVDETRRRRPPRHKRTSSGGS